MIDVILLELEGVVFDTRRMREACLNEALAAHGLTSLSEADDVLTDLVALRTARSFSSRISVAGVAIRPGARAFLENVAAHARLGIVTSSTRSEADAMLQLASVADLFVVRICRDDVLVGKPSADGYNLALDRLDRQRSIKPRRVLALESDAAGIRAARRAGLRCVAVGPMEAHVAIDADALVESLEGQTLASLVRLSRSGLEPVQ